MEKEQVDFSPALHSVIRILVDLFYDYYSIREILKKYKCIVRKAILSAKKARKQII